MKKPKLSKLRPRVHDLAKMSTIPTSLMLPAALALMQSNVDMHRKHTARVLRIAADGALAAHAYAAGAAPTNEQQFCELVALEIGCDRAARLLARMRELARECAS